MTPLLFNFIITYLSGWLCSIAASATWTEIDLDEVEMEDMIGGGGFALVYKAVYRGGESTNTTFITLNFKH